MLPGVRPGGAAPRAGARGRGVEPGRGAGLWQGRGLGRAPAGASAPQVHAAHAERSVCSELWPPRGSQGDRLSGGWSLVQYSGSPQGQAAVIKVERVQDAGGAGREWEFAVRGLTFSR